MSGTSLKKLGLFQGCWKLLRARGVSAKGASRAAGANRTKEAFCYVLFFFLVDISPIITSKFGALLLLGKGR